MIKEMHSKFKIRLLYHQNFEKRTSFESATYVKVYLGIKTKIEVYFYFLDWHNPQIQFTQNVPCRTFITIV